MRQLYCGRGFQMKFAVAMSIIAMGLSLTSSAFAQSQQRNFSIALSESQLQYIAKVLGKQPFEESAPTIAAIQQQINQQVQAEAKIQADDRQKMIDKEVQKKLDEKAEDKK